MNTPHDFINKSKRHLPHWTQKDAVYSVTFCVWEGELNTHEQNIVLEHIKDGSGKYYHLYCANVMPDHVHLIIKLVPDYNLSRVMKGIKGVSARKINQKRKSSGRIWEDESFDHIIRDEKELYEKIQYIFENPVRKGLTNDPEKYHGWYLNNKLEL